jgi:hypothetical protein
MATSNCNSNVPVLWDFPDSILFYVVSFVAPPTHRAAVICHQLAPLCSSCSRKLLDEQHSLLWDVVLKEDYGVTDESHSKSTRRSCKRLRRSSLQRVMESHKLIKDNSEIAYFYLSEMVNSSSDKLTKTKLIALLEEYGPHLRLNNQTSSGGLYLVEVCRARHVKEAVILKCARELVDVRGALVDMSTRESPVAHLTALCTAAARGMVSVVKYLLDEKAASKSIRSSGRFRLHSQPKKTLTCRDVTPLEFARAMLNAEREAGGDNAGLNDLKSCIRLLEK